jgi:uncharacterized membrane protein
LACAVSADGNTIVGNSDFKAAPVGAFIWNQQDGMRNFKQLLVNDCNLLIDKWPAERGTCSALNLAINDCNQPLGKWSLLSAQSISDDGTVIVGNGTNPRGDSEGWIVKLPKKD